MQDYQKLEVWQKAHILTMNVYKATLAFPGNELYGLTSQVRRAGVSIPSNISEGCSRESKSEFSQFLKIALGSANELEYQLLLARDLQYLNNEVYDSLNDQVDHVRRMLISLIQTIKGNC